MFGGASNCPSKRGLLLRLQSQCFQHFGTTAGLLEMQVSGSSALWPENSRNSPTISNLFDTTFAFCLVHLFLSHIPRTLRTSSTSWLLIVFERPVSTISFGVVIKSPQFQQSNFRTSVRPSPKVTYSSYRHRCTAGRRRSPKILKILPPCCFACWASPCERTYITT